MNILLLMAAASALTTRRVLLLASTADGRRLLNDLDEAASRLDPNEKDSPHGPAAKFNVTAGPPAAGVNKRTGYCEEGRRPVVRLEDDRAHIAVRRVELNNQTPFVYPAPPRRKRRSRPAAALAP